MNIRKKVVVLMGSKDDYEIMQYTENALRELSIDYEMQTISPYHELNTLSNFIQNAQHDGCRIIIASSGSSSPHLPSIVASLTELPVLAVPIESRYLQGLNSIIPILQTPVGVAIGIMAFGEFGAKNAAALANAILSTLNEIMPKIHSNNWHKIQTNNSEQENNNKAYSLNKAIQKNAKQRDYHNTELYKQAVDLLLKDRNVSISYIQRKLGIGFNRAAKIMDEMESNGIVSTANHRGKRRLLVQ
ncbi:5-(carboxyamino)imidazole ribonucleotide mutase [Candidatus Xenohaliotis californiensis]|uniref:5-(Carboxyamino)imidazole ribonucleotide mutase n=1 Tax=Candidatus Xenohaliotis californiensis TaxID=84677 RepID=A0ABP0EU02_9RICK|nr:5-(carboxyamino)imidazole ribonucleotide mutase [Candidatus Xenohaliotis californiensis]